MFKSLLIYLILFICINNHKVQNGEAIMINNSTKTFKLAILTTGELNDFGFNAMINDAKVAMEKILNTTDINIFIVDEHDAFDVMQGFIKGGVYTAIIAGSLEYTAPCVKLAALYPGFPMLTRGGAPPNQTLNYVTYNIGICQYIMGYFAGLMTQTNVLGYVAPGAPLINNYNANTFYVGALKAKKDINRESDNVTLHLYNTGSWIERDIAEGATNLIMDLDADYISHTQDDMSVALAQFKRGKMAMGTNGFPQKRIYGEQIALSFITNWTTIYVKFAQKVIANDPSQPFMAEYGTFWDFLSLDEFSINVPQTVQTMVKAEITRLMGIPRPQHPYYCSPLNVYIFNASQLINGTCFPPLSLFSINTPYPGMTFHGFYTVPLVRVNIDSSITIAFSTVAGVFAFLSVVAAIVIFIYKDTHSIRSASPIFCFVIITGAVLTYLGVIVWVNPNTTPICNARYWLIALGYALFIGALVVKNVRIWLIFDNPELRSIKITNQDLFPWVAAVVAVKIVLLAIMTSSVGNNHAENQNISGLGKYEYTPVCTMTNQGNGVLFGILGSFGALLLLGVFVSWKIRIVDIEEFNESRVIANTLYIIAFCLFVIVPLMVSPQSPTSQTIIICSAVLFITTASLSILFLPKFWRIAKYGAESSTVYSSNKKSSIASSRSKSVSNSSQVKDGDMDDVEKGADDEEPDFKNPQDTPRVNMSVMLAQKPPKTPPPVATIDSDPSTVVPNQQVNPFKLSPYDGPVHATFDSDEDILP